MAKLTNQDYIDKYKLDNVIIVKEYQDESGELVDGIVSPLKIDNRQIFAPIDHQKDTPHCAGFSAANLCESVIWKNTGRIVQLDAHQIYAKAKEIDGYKKTEGTFPNWALQSAINLGVFGDRKYKVKTIYNSGKSDLADKIKHLIHKHDFLLGGFLIKECWYYCTKNNYTIKWSYGKSIGGHAVCLVGYNKTGVMIANSWSSSWGAKGFAIISWDVFLQDFMYASYLELEEE